mgnify:CR=1 FL=1
MAGKVTIDCENCGNSWNGKHPDDRTGYGKPTCPECGQRAGTVAEGQEPEDSDDSDGTSVSSEPTTVTPDDFRSTEPTEVTANDLGLSEYDTADSSGKTDDSLPFDPTDPDAHELDGSEGPLTVRHGGSLTKARPDAGDWILVDETSNPPAVLYDADSGRSYELITE